MFLLIKGCAHTMLVFIVAFVIAATVLVGYTEYSRRNVLKKSTDTIKDFEDKNKKVLDNVAKQISENDQILEKSQKTLEANLTSTDKRLTQELRDQRSVMATNTQLTTAVNNASKQLDKHMNDNNISVGNMGKRVDVLETGLKDVTGAVTTIKGRVPAGNGLFATTTDLANIKNQMAGIPRLNTAAFATVSDVAILKNQVTGSASELASLKSKMADIPLLNKGSFASASDFTSLSSKTNNLTNTVNTLQNRVDRLPKNSSSSSSSSSSRNNNNNNNSGGVSTSALANYALMSDLNSLSGKHSLLSTTVNALQSKVDKLPVGVTTSTVAANSGSYANLSDFNQLRTNYSGLSDTVTNLKGQVDTAKTDINTLKTNVQTLTTKSSQPPLMSNGMNTSANMSQYATATDVTNLKSQYTTAAADINNLRKSITTTSDDMTAVRKTLDGQKSEFATTKMSVGGAPATVAPSTMMAPFSKSANSWISSASGVGEYNNVVVMGNYGKVKSDVAVIGGQDKSFSKWTDLVINPEGSANVGVGVMKPEKKLDVGGGIRSSSELCIGSTCMTEVDMKMFKSLANSLYAFVSATFTSGGAVGPVGPNLNQARQGVNQNDWSYIHLNMSTNGIMLWNVPSSDKYKIRAAGAAGGKPLHGNKLPGNGIIVEGIFNLNKGQILYIVVGQKGLDDSASPNISAGGGGGSFVATDQGKRAIIVAGGGGGASGTNHGAIDGGNGLITTSGGGGGLEYSGHRLIPGSNGNGATRGANGHGGGTNGGGFLSNGTHGNSGSGNGFAQGAVGGGSKGGFGGGGQGYSHSQNYSGGGGGGYSGGSAGIRQHDGEPIASGGGGSFGEVALTSPGFNSDAGYVIITKM